MSRLPRTLLALLFGVFLAVGASLSVVHASNMAVGMAAASDMAAPDNDGCDDKRLTGMDCGSVCPPGAFAVLLPTNEVMALGSADLVYPDSSPAIGRASPPDPHPPKTADLA
jgi:hypothetical protein